MRIAVLLLLMALPPFFTNVGRIVYRPRFLGRRIDELGILWVALPLGVVLLPLLRAAGNGTLLVLWLAAGFTAFFDLHIRAAVRLRYYATPEIVTAEQLLGLRRVELP